MVDVGARHDLDVRCVWLDTGSDDAQLNVVERLFARYGKVPDVAELRGLAKQDPQALWTPPTGRVASAIVEIARRALGDA